MRQLGLWLCAEEVAVFKEYWKQNNHYAYINWRPESPNVDLSKYAYIDKRLLIKPGSQAWQILRDKVDQLYPAGTVFWANYQQQIYPHSLHVDEYGRDRKQPTDTIICALDTEPKFKVYIFKEWFNDCASIEPFFVQCKGQPAVSNFSDLEDVEHCMDLYQPTANRCDYLTVDGVFSYQQGHAILFDTNQIHTSSYWVKYPEFSTRDLLQLHIGEPSRTSFDQDNQITHGTAIPDVDSMTVVG